MSESSPELKYAPREAFETILEWAVIPTFDLVISYGDEGVIMVKRKIAPYKDVWALPGLRMFKPELIDDTLRRIGRSELGLEIDPSERQFLGQYVGRFKTEYARQDLSTGYHVHVDSSQKIELNSDHFSSVQVTTKVPERMGAMYRYYLERYWSSVGERSV